MPTLKEQSTTSELDEKVLNFFARIQDEAKGLGMVYFVDTLEGRTEEVGDLFCEEESGWLTPEEKAEEFAAVHDRRGDELYEDDNGWGRFYMWVDWEKDERADKGVAISFVEY